MIHVHTPLLKTVKLHLRVTLFVSQLYHKTARGTSSLKTSSSERFYFSQILMNVCIAIVTSMLLSYIPLPAT